MVASGSALATELDLTAPPDNTGVHALTGTVGGDALFGNFTSHPTGTGVYDPFLTLERQGNGNTEGAYNTDGHTALYLDQQRPEWNTRLTLGDLAVVNVNNVNYYAFELDANEPSGGTKNLISIDNIRIYTSSADNTATVGNTEANLNSLGTLRWAMNDPLKDANGDYIIDNWVKLDASFSDTLQQKNGGSGYSDMIAYIPVAAFAGASSSDYLWFYNLNGVHYSADSGLAAEAGYEEWRAVVGNVPSVPDGGTTLMLLGSALAGLGFVGRRCRATR